MAYSHAQAAPLGLIVSALLTVCAIFSHKLTHSLPSPPSPPHPSLSGLLISRLRGLDASMDLRDLPWSTPKRCRTTTWTSCLLVFWLRVTCKSQASFWVLTARLLTRRPAEGSTPLTTAFQLGLYRDGTVINLADKREIEVRRRAWAMLYHLDR